jgi:aminopeptidase
MGGNPFVTITDSKISRLLSIENSPSYWDNWTSLEIQKMKLMQCYIAIRGGYNEFEASDIPQAQSKLIRSITRPLIDERVNNSRWCILKWPTSGMSQLNEMSTEAFEDFYFNVCTYDYSKMAEPAEALRQRLLKTDKVRIVGNGTDISFSIKDLPAISCTGTHNIPDGEVFTAPVKDSVNGVISYNTKTSQNGTPFSNIKLTVENGKIVSWDGSNKEKLDSIFNTDEGARYFGEFALGINPFISKATGDILFDEKIHGSIHTAVGNSYNDCDNGNKSSIHWDLVLIQTPEFGGGKIWFDNELVREDGLFVVDDLKCCNPDELLR